MYMKQNNAGKKIWLRAQTLNQKLKEAAQTQLVMMVGKLFSVLYTTRFEVISQH